MPKKAIYTFFLIIITSFSLCAQDDEDTREEKPKFAFRPTIGLGVGMFTFYGDIAENQKGHNPIVSRLGFDIMISQPINSWLDAHFYFLYGKLGANENTITRNLNFESEIVLGGFNVSYNFDHLFKNKDRVIEPYISLGIESFEFLSKTDLIDQYGNTYYYWNDGSIRNIDQNASNASDAIRLQRDYNYESDIRELNLDDFGKYTERSFAVPIGAGVNLKPFPQVQFRIGTSLHLTFTDMIDGVSHESTGVRKGNDMTDMFLFTSFNLSYNLITNKQLSGMDDDEDGEWGDFYAIENEDEDQDGILDFDDLCAGTEPGVEVDDNGCPKYPQPDDLDTAQLALNYQMRMDSIGEFSKIEDTVRATHEGEKTIGVKKKGYMVHMGSYNGGIPEDLAAELLSIPDINTWVENGKTYITVGNYDNLPDAVKRKLDMVQQGYETAAVVQKADDGGVEAVADEEIKAATIKTADNTTGQAVYRVQIGAFSKQVSKNVFSDVPDLVTVPSQDDYNRYYSGAFTTMGEAAERKIDLMVDGGFQDAFVVAFKDGKRISLGQAGATPAEETTSEEDINVIQDDTETGAVDKKLVKFSVQIGVFKQAVPGDIMDTFMKLDNVKPMKADNGMTRYLSGSYSSYEEAKSAVSIIAEHGVEGAFVVGMFKGNPISAQEAIELLSK